MGSLSLWERVRVRVGEHETLRTCTNQGLMDTDNDIAAALRAHLGADAVGDDTGAFAVAGRSPSCVVSPASVAQVREALSFAHERRLAVVPCGNGTHLHVGSPPARYDLALSLRRLSRVLAHEAADMTVTVEAGASLAALNSTLAATGQWLPFDPPRRDRVTVGGLIAGDLNGPLRLSQGKVRDSLIGITVALADGAVVKAGGKVVKNVAGYDLAKLFTGSAGTLGVIVEATFKIRPRPEATRVVWLPADSLRAAAEVAAAITELAVAPLFLEIVDLAAATEAGLGSAGVAVGLGGIVEELEAQQAALSRLRDAPPRVLDDSEAARVGEWLSDFPRQSKAAVTARISLLPTELFAMLPRVATEAGARGLALQLVAHAGNGVARARIDGDEAQAVLFCEWLRITAREHGGWVVFDHLADALHGRVDPFGHPGPAAAADARDQAPARSRGRVESRPVRRGHLTWSRTAARRKRRVSFPTRGSSTVSTAGCACRRARRTSSWARRWTRRAGASISCAASATVRSGWRRRWRGISTSASAVAPARPPAPRACVTAS